MFSLMAHSNGLVTKLHEFQRRNNILFLAINRRYDDYFEDDYYQGKMNQGKYENKVNRLSDHDRNSTNRLSDILELFKNQKQLGASLVGFGLMVTFIGLMFFFNGTLLRIGNLSIIIGIPMLVGPGIVKQYFLKRSRAQSSIIIAFGVLLVMLGKPRFGILLEIFGLLNSVRNMNPLLVSVIKKLPLVGDVIAIFERDSDNNNSIRKGQYQKTIRLGDIRSPISRVDGSN